MAVCVCRRNTPSPPPPFSERISHVFLFSAKAKQGKRPPPLMPYKQTRHENWFVTSHVPVRCSRIVGELQCLWGVLYKALRVLNGLAGSYRLVI